MIGSAGELAYAACWIDSQAACSVTSRAADDREVDVQAALAKQEALLGELDGRGEADGYVFEEIAECLLALGPRRTRERSSGAHTPRLPATFSYARTSPSDSSA